MCIRLAEWTTLGVGGMARELAVAYSAERLAELAAVGRVLGRGSNVLVSDDGYDGTIAVNRYETVTTRGDLVTAGSGTRLSVLAAVAAERGLSGLEWAHGIPGSVGGAVVMNAGAFGGGVSRSLVYADVLESGDVKRRYAEEFDFGYRRSGIRGTVISATFATEPKPSHEIRERMAELAELRRKKQPRGKSAGSVFKNPPGQSAGKILDEAGLKGCRRGGAIISREHANIIVNTGGATARDVVSLISVMREALLARGVTAEEEIIYIGDFGGINGVSG